MNPISVNRKTRSGNLAVIPVIGAVLLLAAGCASTEGPPVGNTRSASTSGFGEFGQYGSTTPVGAQCGQRAGLQGSNGYHR